MNLREALPRLAFDRPVSVVMLFVALVVVGVIAWARIPVQMMPGGFEPGFLWVWLPYGNAGAQEVDDQVVRPVLAQLGTVPGIQSMRSTASDNGASFAIELHGGAELSETYNAVIDRIERAMPDLPDDLERYFVYRYNPNDSPIVWAGVQIPPGVEDPYHILHQVIGPRLERVPGVANLDLWGVPQRAVWIDYDKERLYAHGVNLGPVISRLSTDNFQIPGGEIHERGQVRTVRSLSPVPDLETLRAFPIEGDVRLGDVADISLRQAMSADISRINGEAAAGLALRKESSANTVEVTRAVEAVLRQLEADPRAEGTRFFTFFSQGELIETSIDDLLQTALTGGLFAVLILYLFLRDSRSTLLIAAAIPLSMLITVGLLYFLGHSLNLLSLMGLMLAVGMVVDNAIVVVETIARYRAEGRSVREAAIEGTGEVNLAILLSTLTTVVVFLPVVLMSESAALGFFLGVIGLPVALALGASLVVALLFAPLATRALGEGAVRPEPRWLVWLTDRYAAALARVLQHRVDAAVSLVALGLFTTMVVMPGTQCTTSDSQNLNDFVVRFTVPPQADPYQRDDIVRAIEAVVDANREAWGVRVYRADLSDGAAFGILRVFLEADGPLPREDVMQAALAAMPQELPGVRTSLGWGGDAGPSQASLELTVYGENTEVLAGLADELVRRLRPVEGVLDVRRDDEAEGLDEIQLRIDRDAASRYGVSAGDVGRLVAFAMRGSTFPSLQLGGREVPVRGRFSLEDRSDVDKLRDFDVWSPVTRSMVPIASLTSISFAKGPQSIVRRDRRTSSGVTIDLKGDITPGEVTPRIDAALADMAFPRGYGWSHGESSRAQADEDAALGFALLLSVVFVYLLIGMLFESWVLPMSIVTTIPMAMMGALWGLWISGTALDTMAGVGLVVLIGVVVNNGIVLIDLVTQLRREGMPRDEALVEAGRRRLRPILMTALTTICGLLPMALGSSTFVGMPYAPLGRCVIGGLVSATLLTLLFVPYLYRALDDLRLASASWWAFVRGTTIR